MEEARGREGTIEEECIELSEEEKRMLCVAEKCLRTAADYSTAKDLKM